MSFAYVDEPDKHCSRLHMKPRNTIPLDIFATVTIFHKTYLITVGRQPNFITRSKGAYHA